MSVARAAWLRHFGWAIALTLATLAARATAQQTAAGVEKSTKSQAASVEPVEVRFVDGSTLKVKLKDERVQFATRYGTLEIPVRDLRRIDFGLRIDEETRKRIAAAAADLGHTDYRRRQTASAELVALKEKAYPAILLVSQGKDQEAVRRARQLLDKIREEVGAENLEVPDHDVVFTEDSKIAGHLTVTTLHVSTLPFGEQQIRLSDLRSLRNAASSGNDKAEEALADPGSLILYQNDVGKRLTFKVTGALPGQRGGARFGGGGVYGTGTYTLDSALAYASVHAGVLQPGKTGVVHVTILGPQAGFQGSVQNGVQSMAYGAWAGYRIETERAGKRGE